MPDRDPLADVLARYEQPAMPTAVFAVALRHRLLAELVESAPTTEVDVLPTALPSNAPRIIRLPGVDGGPSPRTAAPRWRLIVHVLSAAALLLTLAGGALLGRGVAPYLASLWQAPAPQAARHGVPMAGVDPGRTNSNPGPAPDGIPASEWDTFAGVGAHPPIVVDGSVYVTVDIGDVVAFDQATGAERWRVALGGGTDTPTFADGVLYVSVVTDSETGNSGGVLIALDAADGSERWRSPTGAFGGASPVVVDGVVYAGGDQELYAFDAATGEQRWVFAIDAPPCVCTPRPAAVGNGLVYVVPGGMQQASLFAVDAGTGAERWRYDGQLSGESMRFTDPVVADGLVFVGEGELFEPAESRFVALEAETGEEAWTVELDVSAPPAVADGVLYVQSRVPGSPGGALSALDAKTGETLWKVPTLEASLAQPAVAEDLVLVPAGTREGYAPGFDDVMLVAFEASTGTKAWRVDLAGSISGPPAIVDGVIYVTTYSEGALFDLGGSGAATPIPESGIDLSGREPCDATPVGDPYAEERLGTPLPAVMSRGQWKEGVTAEDLPAGPPASDAVIAAMNETLQAFVRCVGDDPALLYGFFSDGYFARLARTMEVAGMPPDADVAVTWHLPSFSPFADLSIREARILPDGRAAGIFDGGFNPIFIVFAEQDGVWLIDELGGFSDLSRQPAAAATPTG